MMNINKKAFTLAEMLFVVVIVALVLTFGAHKIKNAKERGVEKGATGFLVDLANATEAMRRDLAMQGVNLDQLLQAHSTDNISVPTTVTAASTDKKSLRDYLTGNYASNTAFINAFMNALSEYGYVDFTIPSVGEYSYYIYIGRNISDSCGTLGTLPSNIKPVAYMCKAGVSGWAYLNDGTIRELAVSN